MLIDIGIGLAAFAFVATLAIARALAQGEPAIEQGETSS
jgi:hypothetical protein